MSINININNPITEINLKDVQGGKRFTAHQKKFSYETTDILMKSLNNSNYQFKLSKDEENKMVSLIKQYQSDHLFDISNVREEVFDNVVGPNNIESDERVNRVKNEKEIGIRSFELSNLEFNNLGQSKSIQSLKLSSNKKHITEIIKSSKTSDYLDAKNKFSKIEMKKKMIDSVEINNSKSQLESKKTNIESENFSSSVLFKKITSFLYKNVKHLELLHFVMNPLPKDKTLICKIIRKEINIMGKLYPKYYLYINNNDKLLLSAKKVYMTTSITYRIFTEDLDITNDDFLCYLGKITSNFIGNEFNIFDDGKKPSDKQNPKDFRSQFGAIKYCINLLGFKGPMKMTVYLPRVDASTDEIEIHKPKNSKEYLQNNNNLVIREYINKPPEWNDMFKSFFLKFNGRVQQGSSKNFKLIDLKKVDQMNKEEEDEDEEVYLQFGKINETTFAMDFQYPLSPFQAFSICLSSLATKFACE